MASKNNISDIPKGPHLNPGALAMPPYPLRGIEAAERIHVADQLISQ